MGMRVLGAALLLCLFSCTPVSSDVDILTYSLPKMDDMTCYQAEKNNGVMSCTEGDVLPQDPNLLNTIFEATLSFFPTLEVGEGMKFISIYQSVTAYEERLYERIPQFKEVEEDGVNFYVHAHTYFDPDENAIVIESPTPMNVQTIVHEILHHVVEQLVEDDILDHLIIDRMANLIIESKRFKDALRENH